jgi:hypothetical protein
MFESIHVIQLILFGISNGDIWSLNPRYAIVKLLKKKKKKKKKLNYYRRNPIYIDLTNYIVHKVLF